MTNTRSGAIPGVFRRISTLRVGTPSGTALILVRDGVLGLGPESEFFQADFVLVLLYQPVGVLGIKVADV